MRCTRWLVTTTVFCSLFGAAFAAETTKRPNILFIYTDDLSHRVIGCYPEALP